MAYVKQNFRNDNVLEDYQLNNIEDALADNIEATEAIQTDIAENVIKDIRDTLGNSLVTERFEGGAVNIQVSGGGGGSTASVGALKVDVNVTADGLSTRTYYSGSTIAQLNNTMQLAEVSCDPEIIGSEWDVTAGDGSLTITGTIKKAGTVTLIFVSNGAEFIGSYKDTVDGIVSATADNKPLKLSASLNAQTFSATTIITDSRVTSDMVVTESVLSNPSAQNNDWTISTGAGTVKLTGTASAATTLTLILQKCRS